MYDKVVYNEVLKNTFCNLPDGSKYLIYSALINYYENYSCADLRQFLKASGYSHKTLSSVRYLKDFIDFLEIGYPGPEVSYE